ncbi:SIMPL domain-containing protein, partial [Klebsiella pneumoniae]|uniref:SIMPL domain-containing protein n=1 Tax=Klebsiella pneumoniae TaxID=573 RepID=UPI002731424B
YPPTITVNGIGTAYAEPETAVISFGFSVTETDPEIAVQSAAEQAESALASAEAAGIDRESITTTGYSLWIEEEYDYNTYTY